MKQLPALVAGLLALALTASADPTAPRAPAIPYTATRLSDRVILLDCQDVHVTAIAARSGIVVIDTGRSRSAMLQLRRAIEQEFGRSDFLYLVNTHGDPDHSAGNRAFPSVPLIAHQAYAEYVLHARAATLLNRWSVRSRLKEARARYRTLERRSAEAEELQSRIASLEALDADQRDGQAPRTPAIAFEDSLRLDLGDLPLELHFCGEAHTNHDIVVYVPEEKLLLAGDLICSPRQPCFPIDAMADVPRLVRELEALLQRDAGLETIVPGHGACLTRADLAGFCRTVAEQFANVRVERSAARILERTIETNGIQAALERCRPPAPASQGALDWSEEELATLGSRLMRGGRIHEAVSVLRLAVRAVPGSAYLHDRLGEACLEGDDRAAAVAAYERSLALEPGNRHAAEMLEVIRRGE